LDKLDWHSRKLERDHKAIKAAAIKLHRQGILDEKLLDHTIEKAFNLGHQAGFNHGKMKARCDVS